MPAPSLPLISLTLQCWLTSPAAAHSLISPAAARPLGAPPHTKCHSTGWL